MDGCTVNISDFRCRPYHARASVPARSATHLQGFGIVQGRELGTQQQIQPADEEQNSTVCDISTARSAQRRRVWTMPRPISIQRRAKVLHFAADAPVRMMIARADQVRSREEHRSAAADGPCDLPPAA